MPDYTAPITAIPGQPLPSADWNAGVRDNFMALGQSWIPYAPTWGSTGVAPAIGNGSIVGRSRKFGKTLDVIMRVTMGTTTTYGGAAWTLSLPAGLVTPASGIQIIDALAVDFGLAFYLGKATIDPGANIAIPFFDVGAAGAPAAFPTGAVPFAWGNGDILLLQGSIELA